MTTEALDERTEIYRDVTTRGDPCWVARDTKDQAAVGYGRTREAAILDLGYARTALAKLSNNGWIVWDRPSQPETLP